MKIVKVVTTKYELQDFTYEEMIDFSEYLVQNKIISNYEEVNYNDQHFSIALIGDGYEVGNYAYGTGYIDKELYEAIPDIIKDVELRKEEDNGA